MKTYKKMYVWVMNAKLFMSIYFVAIVFLTGLTIALCGGNQIALLTLAEMLVLSAVVAVLQCILLDDKTDYSRGIFFGRSLAWIAISALLTVGSALLLNWFANLPTWCPWMLGAFMIIGLSCCLAGLKYEQDADTVKLNADLESFKKSGAQQHH